MTTATSPTYIHIGTEERDGITYTVEGVEESRGTDGQIQLLVSYDASGAHYITDPNMRSEVSPDDVDAEVMAWLASVNA